MSILEERLIGRRLVSISFNLCAWSLEFSDGSGMTINTLVETVLRANEGEDIVTGITNDDASLLIHLGKDSSVRISLDETLMSGPEIFVLCDSEGNYIVERGEEGDE